jgi:bifunctional DNase/RNase
MVEVKIAGIQVNLMSQQRVVLLKEVNADRYLPIWVGPCEAEAINIKLQQVEFARPLTHDLLKNVIEALGGQVERIVVTALREDTFYARIFIAVGDGEVEIDSRPSDAMALAVRVPVPLYVADEVMAEAAITPERDLISGKAGGEPSAFDDFLSSLNVDDLPIQ